MQEQTNEKLVSAQASHFQVPATAGVDVGAQPLDVVGRAAAIDDLLGKIALVREVMGRVMTKGEHYGTIPGCGDKPALFKSGAEKLAMVFRLKAKPTIEIVDLDKGHREYRVSIALSDGSTATGSCSTMENKYRYRQGERRCPKCGQATILASKEGGWFCWKKKGGCAAQFKDDDATIASQQVGKVEHDNPADFYNTCLQMADKRAFVQVVRRATACSDIFREAPEDADPDGDDQQHSTTAASTTKQPPAGTRTLESVKVVMVGEPKNTPDGKKAWLLTLNDGEHQVEAWAFDEAAVRLARELVDTGERASVALAQAVNKSWIVKRIERAEVPPA